MASPIAVVVGGGGDGPILPARLLAASGGGAANMTYAGSIGNYSYALGVLYFLFLALLFGAVTLYLHKNWIYFFPYTAMLFVEGIVLGIVHSATNNGLGDLSISIEQWTSIDAHLLAAVFLPALIFSDAMSVDIHLFRRIFSQAALMATFGVALQCVGMACVARYFLYTQGYLWDWTLCFTFGAVLAATDPVAVVAMLESVRAPPKLMTLMSGESHLSDLLALVTFNIMLTLSKDLKSYSNDELAKYVASMLLGGPALGIAFGALALIGIRANTAKERHSDIMIQVTITLVLAYMSFIVSENNAKGNGVLATVTAALVIAAYAWPSFSSPQVIRNVWKSIEYIGTTLIFTFGGLIIGSTMYEYNNIYITGPIYGVTILLWLFVFMIRTAIMILFFPILRKIGYGLTLKEGVVMTWGGLKGAVAITLGLIVFNSHDDLHNYSNPVVDSKRDVVQFFFLVGGIVFLSVLVNSSTTPFLMRALKILSKTGVQKLLLKDIRNRVRQKAGQAYDEVTAKPEYARADRRVLETLLPDLRYGVIIERKASMKAPSYWTWLKMNLGVVRRVEAPTFVQVDGHNCNLQLLEVVRELFLDIVKASYWEMIENGILPKNSAATRTLLQSVDIAKDSTDKPLSDYKYMSLPKSLDEDKNSLHERFWGTIDRCLPSWVTIDDYFGDKMHAVIRENSVFMASSYIHAHKEAQEKIAQYVGEGDDADSPEEHVVIAESQALVKLATHFMDIAKERDPDIVDLVTTKKVGSHVLKEQNELIDELEDQGVLDDQTAEQLHDLINDEYIQLVQLSLNQFRKGGGSNSSESGMVSAKVENDKESEDV